MVRWAKSVNKQYLGRQAVGSPFRAVCPACGLPTHGWPWKCGVTGKEASKGTRWWGENKKKRCWLTSLKQGRDQDAHNREALMNSQLIYSNNDSITDHSTGVNWTRKLNLYICWRECEWRVPEKTCRGNASVLLLVLRCSYWRYLHIKPIQKITCSSLFEILLSSINVNSRV